MSHPVRGVDHIVYLVSDLDAAAVRFARLGFTLSPRGTHSPHMGSANYTIIFPDDYFELLGVIADTPRNADKRKTLEERGDSMTAIACRIDDARAARTALAELGISASDVMDFSRPLPLPDGNTGVAAFSVTTFGPDEVPGGEMFMCEHKTRDMVWRPELMQHANGAKGLAGIVVATGQPETAAKAYARLFAGARIHSADHGFVVETGPQSASIHCMTHEGLSARYGISAEAHRGDFAVLQIAVSDLAVTQSHMQSAGIRSTDVVGGSLFVQPEVAGGNILEFVET